MQTRQTSQALAKRKAETALMPPPPPPKRIKRPTTVLDEDTYTGALAHIIARDFFPGLLETQTQQEYLDALESKDDEWISEAGRKLTHVMTPGPEGRRLRGRRGTSMAPTMLVDDETPRGWGGDTPMSVASSDITSVGGSKEPQVDLNLSLSAFEAKYTSEDSETFNQLLDKANNKRREKHAWFWNGNKIPSARQIAHQKREAKLLEATSSASASTDLILAERARDKRPAMIDQKKSQPRNSLMFGPESLEDTQQTTAQAAEAKSLAPPKAILHSNTRIPAPQLETEDGVLPSSSMSVVDAAIAGRPRPTETEAGYTGAETPRVGGYAFVDAEPTPAEIAYSRGQNLRDPAFLLSQLTSTDASRNPFTINKASEREELHHRLVEKGSKSKRLGLGRVGDLMSGEIPGRTPTPKFMSASGLKKSAGDLTPAAQMLYRKIGTPIRRGSTWDSKGVSKVQQARWTPGVTPRVRS